MEPLRALPAVVGSLQVHERRGGGQQQADAFRRAMQQRAGDRTDADANANAASNAGSNAGGALQPAPAPAPAPAPLPSGLQRQPPAVRKDDGRALHVDVLA